FVCFDDIGDCRKEYVKEVLQDEIGELSALDEEVVESLRQHEIVSSDIEKQFEKKLTFGERLSDRIAEFGGSWKFLITFGGVIFVVANTIDCSRFNRFRSNCSKNLAANAKAEQRRVYNREESRVQFAIDCPAAASGRNWFVHRIASASIDWKAIREDFPILRER